MKSQCCICDKPSRRAFNTTAYDMPSSPEPTIRRYCSDECRETDLHTGDFQFFECLDCQRLICEQNPRNGWHIQYRLANGEKVCLRCYEAMIVKGGMPLAGLESGKVEGMFFSGDNRELLAAGYTLEEGYYNFFICSKERADQYCRHAIALILAGHQVVNAYESMGIGGSEGYVSMYFKKKGGE
jgi:hypothetical protein